MTPGAASADRTATGMSVVARLGLQAAEDFFAGYAGQVHVEQDQVGVIAHRGLQAGLPRLGRVEDDVGR